MLTHWAAFRFWTFSELRICRPPPQMWSESYERCGMCWIEWKMNYNYFSRYGWNFIENLPYFEYKNDHNSKNRKFDFSFVSAHSTSSCNFDHFWKKKCNYFCSNIETLLKKKFSFFLVEGFFPYPRLVDPSRNRLASTAYFAIGSSVIYAHQNPIFFQKWSNLHERCGISWIERKITVQIFSIFTFRVMVIFY